MKKTIEYEGHLGGDGDCACLCPTWPEPNWRLRDEDYTKDDDEPLNFVYFRNIFPKEIGYGSPEKRYHFKITIEATPVNTRITEE